MSEKSITPVLPGDAVPAVGARTTKMCAMPRQAPRHQQLSVLGQMRVMVGDRHQHRSVPGHPCVPPALISSLLVGRRGTHRLEELRAVLTLRLTNEMGFQLRFSLPGLPVCGAPADALPVPPTRLRAHSLAMGRARMAAHSAPGDAAASMPRQRGWDRDGSWDSGWSHRSPTVGGPIPNSYAGAGGMCAP